MALIIYQADGWDSLVTLAEAQAYMDSYGHDWPAEEAKQEVALRKGSQYLMSAYQIDPKYLDPIGIRGGRPVGSCEDCHALRSGLTGFRISGLGRNRNAVRAFRVKP